MINLGGIKLGFSARFCLNPSCSGFTSGIMCSSLSDRHKVSNHKAKFFFVFKAAHVCQLSLNPAAAHIPQNPPLLRRYRNISGFGSSTKSSGQMDLLSPLHPIQLAQQKAAPYSGVGSQGGRRIEFYCRYAGKETDCSAEMQRVSGDAFLPTFKNDQTGGCTHFRPLTRICIYFIYITADHF